MMRTPEGAPERSPKAGAAAPSGVDGNGPKPFSVQRKMAIVARLLRGEPLELVVRETNVKSKPARGDGDRFSVLPVGPQVSCVVRSTGSSTGWRSSQTQFVFCVTTMKRGRAIIGISAGSKSSINSLIPRPLLVDFWNDVEAWRTLE